MKCEYCGTELSPNDEKCPGCFAAIDKAKVDNNTPELNTNPPVNKENNNNNNQNNNMNQNYNSNNAMLQNQMMINEQLNKENKKNKNLIIILIAIIVGLVVFGLFFFLLDDNVKKNESGSSNSSKYELSDEVITVGNYTFNVPKGWTHSTHNNYEYLQGNECIIIPTQYAINYKTIINNKQYFIDSLGKQGYVVDSFTTRKIDNKEYIVAVGSMNNIGYGFMFSDLDSETTIFITITSNSTSKFDEEWFNYGSLVVKSAKKIK